MSSHALLIRPSTPKRPARDHRDLWLERAEQHRHVHRSLGIELVGVMKSAGWKSGRWLDVVSMQKALGPGGTAAAVELA